MSKLAIIGGTGLNLLNGLETQTSQSITTPFGSPSADYICGNLNGLDIVFLARHGAQHTIPPHKINYQANIWGLKELGVTDIVAVAAVGGITSTMLPSKLAIPDQIIDYSYGREHTFFADNFESHNHIDFTFPYNKDLRQQLIQSAKNSNLTLNHTGTYGCTQGPRLESTAEIIRMERDGCDLVGMTGMPEAALAKELGLNYATIAVIVNWAAGKSTGEILFSEIEHNIKIGMADVDRLIASFILSRLIEE